MRSKFSLALLGCALLFGASASALAQSANTQLLVGSKSSDKTSERSLETIKADRMAALKRVKRADFAEVNGWKFITHVSLQSDLNSKTAKPGDPVWGLLDDDCKFGSKLIAASDSLIKGHLVETSHARTLVHSALSKDRRFHSGGRLGIQFDEIIDQDGKSWPIVGSLCRLQFKRDTVGGAPRLVEIDKHGKVTKGGEVLTDKQKTIFTGIRAATMVPLPASYAINMAAGPVVMGLAGAAYPAFVYNKPVKMGEKGVRTKAFAYGFLTNLPGAVVVQACVEKGTEIELKPGDQLIVDMTFKENEFSSKGKLCVTGAVVK